MKIIRWMLIGVLVSACGGGGGGANSNGGNHSSSNKSTSSSVQSSIVTNRSPAFFIVQAVRVDNHSISITWLSSTDPDGDQLSYRVHINDQLVNENFTDRAITFNDLLPDTQYSIKVEAIDPHGLITPAVLSIRTRNDDGELSLGSTQIDSLTRNYALFKPGNPDGKKLPLVIWFHGAGYRLPSTILQDYWIELAQREQFYLLAPLAVSDKFETFTYWNAGLGYHKDDVLLTKTAVAALVEQGNIDTDRIYTAGMSSGGHMAFYTAFKLQDQIAAVAPIAGSISLYTLYPTPTSPGVFDAYQLRKPMPICHIHGNTDTIVNLFGGIWYASWSEIRSRWISTNKTNTAPAVIMLPDTNKNDGSTVTKYEYRGATVASDIDDYLINNGSHSVPGIDGYANQDINAYEVIWEFFKRHRLGDPY